VRALALAGLAGLALPLGSCGPAEPPVSYTAWESCDLDGCLADRVSRCEAVQTFYAWGLGSEALRVCAKESATCVVTVRSEVEGGLGGSLCRVPRSLGAWPSLTAGEGKMLDDVRAYCQQRMQCNLLINGDCPDDPLVCP